MECDHGGSSETNHGSETSITITATKHQAKCNKQQHARTIFTFARFVPLFRFLRQATTMAAAYPPHVNVLSSEMEARVGLARPNVGLLRRNKQSTTSILGDQLTGGHSHMQGMRVDPARALLDALPAALKDAPPDANIATAVSHLADYAGVPRPDGCVNFFPNAPVPIPAPPKTTEYLTPGGIIFPNIVQAEDFIRFLDANMWGSPHRLHWWEMTGRERFEWYKAFVAAEYTPQRVEQFTLGLRGTDIDLITTPAQLRAAALRSPSLVSEGREDERDAHPLANNHWTTAKRHIMFR